MMRRCTHCKKRHLCQSKAKRAARSRKEKARAEHRVSTKEIGAAVAARAQGRCEAGGCENPPSHMDHWLSGGGRRREKQSVETCWMLCLWCHKARTENFPSVNVWNEEFKEHCEKYGYPFTPHIEHAPVVQNKARGRRPESSLGDPNEHHSRD